MMNLATVRGGRVGWVGPGVDASFHLGGGVDWVGPGVEASYHLGGGWVRDLRHHTTSGTREVGWGGWVRALRHHTSVAAGWGA